MKTGELVGPALDWAVAQIVGIRVLESGEIFIPSFGCNIEEFMPSVCWNQGGSIIEDNGISLSAYCGKDDTIDWYAGRCSLRSPTALIAAMRCYVYSEIGAEVEIPEELT